MVKFKILPIWIVLIIFEISISGKLIIDTDAGADDAAAILLTIKAWQQKQSNFEVIAITCVHGNTDEKNVEVNVLKTLTIANASHIPVYGGSRKPLVSEFVKGTYFGEDGFGDFEFNEEITAEVNRSIPASVLLVNLANQYPGELNILALGPLTNIALAIALDPNFLSNVKRLYVMGGSTEGRGHRSPNVEFNFFGDPTSNFIVFNSTKREPILLFPWEPVEKTNISMRWRIEKLGKLNSPSMNFLNKAERKILTDIDSTWTSADLVTAAAMIWPNLVKKSFVTNITPVFCGEASGSLLVDYYELTGKEKNADIVQDFDVKTFKEIILKYFSK